MLYVSGEKLEYQTEVHTLTLLDTHLYNCGVRFVRSPRAPAAVERNVIYMCCRPRKVDG